MSKRPYSSEKNFDASYLRSILSYDQDTGQFVWKKLLSKRAVPGKNAGWSKDGYTCITIHKRHYRAHRLAWLYVYGEWPEKEIDHINGVRSDNRISNLRQANSSQNKFNTCVRGNSSSGHKGVFWNASRRAWQARIQTSGKVKHLGFYKDLPSAVSARARGEKLHFGEYRRVE